MGTEALDPKQRSIEQWTADPCGPLATEAAALLAQRRQYAPFMADALDYQGTRGLDILDVGCGQGIDLCEYSLAGAKVTGIDLTPRHVELARRHLQELELEGTVVEGDGEDLPFGKETFDRVSSNGVLHHTPDMPQALREIYRVLRPGGRATIIVYNRDSGFYWIEQVLRFGLLQGHLLREGRMENVLSRNVERSSIGARPLVRVYSRRALRRLLLDIGFAAVTVAPAPFRAADTFLTRHLPRTIQRASQRLPLGWYLVAHAERTHSGGPPRPRMHTSRRGNTRSEDEG
jgi:ubiquinone/menaquinone biosynthesis C-methylase UbiE